MTYSFSYLELVCCSRSNSNCCFLTYIQVSQEAGQVVWYFRIFQNFPQFIVIHTVKGFGIVNKAEVDVFLELSCFSMMWLSANINNKSYSKKPQATHIQRVTPFLVVRGFQCNLILYLKEIQHSQKHGFYIIEKANNICFLYCFYFLIHSLSFFSGT